MKYNKSLLQFCISAALAVSLSTLPSLANSGVKPVNKIRVNQHGYLPNQPKHAVYVGAAGTNWQLKNSAGVTVASGTTTAYGNDNASGDNVSHIDFSSYSVQGEGLSLQIGSDSSYPFKISDYVYTFMKEDAMMYFYHQRFGHGVDAQFVGQEFARAAGHFDTNLECDDNLPSDWDPSSHCSYSLDVRGGHQDAGDYGGYVVNGGYYNWLLQYMHEANNNVYTDGSLRIPENNNDVPDILDEARIELDFIMRMQVPQNRSPYPGMIHHKKSYQAWAPFPLAPADDNGIYFGNPQVKRTIKPVSTSATLNGAAVMAQAARLWAAYPNATRFDGSSQPYHQTLLEKAEIAWDAAVANPNLFASRDASQGSGPYDDSKVEDEFYWAAVELYLTTKKTKYKDFLLASSAFAQFRSFDWQEVQVAGNLSLLLHKDDNGLTDGQNAQLENNLKAMADGLVNTINSEGYMTPIAPKAGSPSGGTCSGNYTYPWGSTGSFVLSNAIQMTAAHRVTGDRKYLDGTTRTMDHVLGVNALDRAYMTGYGENPTTEPHHRFWLKAKGNPVTEFAVATSVPYPASMAGGPQNDFVEDGTSGPETDGTPCATPAKSYGDHWNNYSSNEITVNWNANLAAVVAYIEEAIPAPRDTIAPEKLTNIVATPTSGSSITLSWPTAIDNAQVREYLVYMQPAGGNYDLYATTLFNQWSFVPLNPQTEYCFQVIARDYTGRNSVASDEVCATTFAPNAYEIFYQPDNAAMSDYVGTGAINQPEAPKTVLGNGWYHYEFHQEPDFSFHFSMPNFGSPQRFSPDGTGTNWRIRANDFSAGGAIWLTSDKIFHREAPVLQPLSILNREDDDNDGVPNSIDQCPNTPAGTQVDGNGCAVIVVVGDDDNDGVLNNVDQCPNTPAGTNVDEFGCAVIVVEGDDDNDGVLNNVDQCPNTPVGTEVDEFGCAVIVVEGDDDNDGVLNNVDQCPNTPVGTEVDETGCAVIVVVGDDDNDGVLNDVDQCPNTPIGTFVDATGCAIPDTSAPDGFTFAANEGATINVSGTVNLAYGVNGTFNFLNNVTSNQVCDNATFGDPVPGIPKQCYSQPVNTDQNGFTGLHDLPGRIEAEEYAAAPSETTSGNESTAPITNCTYYGLDVDVQHSSDDNTCNVGWTAAGEILEYQVGQAGGRYNINLRASTNSNNRQIRVRVNGTLVGTQTITNNGWNDHVITGVDVPANARIQVEFVQGSVNLNYLQFTESTDSNDACIDYTGTGLSELTLNSASCVNVSDGLADKEIAIADSDANPSCNIRGVANSGNGNGSRVIDGNWERISGGWSGTIINFDISNNCPFLKLRVRPLR
jgi:endoglucanase